MSSKGWNVLKIGNIGRIVTGKTPPTQYAENFGNKYPFITPRDMSGQKRINQTERYLSEKGKNEVKNCLLPVNAICVSCIGSDMGKVVMTTTNSITNQQLNSIICNDSFNPDFIYYALVNISSGLRNIGHNSTAVPILNKTDFSNFEISVPDIFTQRRIAEILSALDDKIELNRQTNATLEAIAQAIFKEWFVDFNFPGATGEMVESELGMIPKGWRVGKLEEIITNFDRKRVPLSSRERENRKGAFPYYGAASILDYVDDYIFDGVYLLMGEDGTVITEDGKPVLQYVSGKFWVNNHTHVLQGKKPFSTEYVLLQLKNTNVKHIVTGAVQPKINQGNMNELPVVIPDEFTLLSFQDIITPIFSNVLDTEQETSILTGIRDNLLPKLMNGEIEV